MPQLTDNIVHKEDYNQLKYEMMLSFVYHSVKSSLESVGYGVYDIPLVSDYMSSMGVGGAYPK